MVDWGTGLVRPKVEEVLVSKQSFVPIILYSNLLLNLESFGGAAD